MKLYEYFSYKTLFYFLKDDSIFKTRAFKENYAEDENGLPTKKYTKDLLDRLFNDRFDNDNEMVVIKTKYGSFVYHKADEPDYAKEMLEKFSKNAPCGVFGSYRTTDVYTFGIANNGRVERYVYTDEEDTVIEGRETEFEQTHPFKLLGEEETKPEEVPYIDEEYVFEIAKWFAGFDIENEDVKILDIKFYKPCPFNGNLTADIVSHITNNLNKAGTDCIGIMISYDRDYKSVIISCENVAEDQKRNVIYCDEINFIKNKKEIDLSFRRCLQAIATLDLTQSHHTLTHITHYYTALNDPKSNIAFVLIDTENKFMIGISKYQKNGKRLPPATNYIPHTNLFYTLSDYTLNTLIKSAIKFIK